MITVLLLLYAEAVFLGVMLTQGWSQLQRLPVGFKSRGSDGQVCKNACLGLSPAGHCCQ
jgi:hypothetical protein